MKPLTSSIPYYNKWIDYPTKLVCKEKCFLLDFLVNASTRSLVFIVHKSIRVEINF